MNEQKTEPKRKKTIGNRIVQSFLGKEEPEFQEMHLQREVVPDERVLQEHRLEHKKCWREPMILNIIMPMDFFGNSIK